MIYNLYQYLKTFFTLLVFIVDGWEVDSPNESVLVSQTGGTPAHWYDRDDYTVQIIVRSMNKVTAKQKADSIFNKMKNRFGLVLPEISVENEGVTTVYPELTTSQISPIQDPGYIGVDDNKRHMYSFNLTVVVGG